MKVVILCGGQGTRLREETEFKPKPMVEIGERPILWHIMKTYEKYGFNSFVLCLGYKGEMIKDYFNQNEERDWDVVLADTGENAMTGARVRKIQEHIDSDLFMLTYGDGVIDLDLSKLVEFHKSHGKIGTVTGVIPQSQYGVLKIEGDHVLAFDEKPKHQEATISGGYFVFNREFFKYINDGEDCVLEKEALQNLAKDGELKVYSHLGFWQCMDTYRDYKYLQELWDNGNCPWRKW